MFKRNFFNALLLISISNIAIEVSTLIAIPNQKSTDLVDITSVNPNIHVHLVYATKDNFTGQIVYSSRAKAYLLKSVADALSKVQQELESFGYGLLVWDAYRPMQAQVKFWEICPDERYVAPPSKGGRHTRGTTVDLTLVNFKTGEQLEMPTEFDNFTERAWRNFEGASSEAKKNRKLLQDTMEKFGFIGLETEWWHFDFKNWQDYKPLTIDFDAFPN